ncbi:MAG: hypothetical protein LWY06_07625 [Firmicutes bacterium]|nr:hypothetical protein [Bacillota bacterium]
MKNDLGKLILRLILSVFVAFVIFSAGSYLVAVPAYIAVPFIVSFLITFIIGDKKIASAASLIISCLGCLIFAAPPFRVPGFTPDSIINNIVSARQAYLLSYTHPLLLGVLGGLLGWGIASITAEKKKALSVITWIFFVVICINFIWVSLDLNPSSIQMAWEEPVPGKYNNYNSLNLKTFYLMKHGADFYSAYSLAFAEKADSPGMGPGNLWNWRMPTVFYIWKWLLPKDGFYIFYFYLIICILMLWLMFSIASVYLEHPLNLIAPLLVCPLFVYGAAGFWYTFSEYWGVFFLFAGIWGIFKRNIPVTAAGITLALVTRSFFIIPWAGLMLFVLLKKDRKQILACLLPFVVFAAAFLAHYFKVMSLSGAEISPPGEWMRGNFSHFLATMGFGSALVSQPEISIPMIVCLAAVVIVKMKNDHNIRMLAGAAFLPMILFIFVGPETERAYWGIIYLPFLLLLAGLCPVIIPEARRKEA